MTAPAREVRNVDHPIQITGTGRPNKLLIRDYAETSRGSFRVETDVDLDPVEFKLLRSLLEDPTPVNRVEIINFLHGKVDNGNKSHREKENAKKMFSAAFDVTT